MNVDAQTLNYLNIGFSYVVLLDHISRSVIRCLSQFFIFLTIENNKVTRY